MALDYSKLSDDELEAIANDDYSKLSDRTLRQLTRDPAAQTATGSESPEVSLIPQAVSGAAAAVPEAVNVAKQVGGLNAAKTATANIRDAVKVGSILADMPVSEYMQNPIKNTAKLAGAYVAGHPYTQAVGNIASGARNVGGALVQGAVAPESLMMLPYQMAAYEQDKIRANPTAPEYATNPYAQAYRGEYPTQGAAGAANARNAVANMATGYTPTAQEAGNLLSSNDERMINIYGGRKRLEEIVASSVRGQAAQRILPVKPGSF